MENLNSWTNEITALFFKREELYKQAAPPVDVSLAEIEDLERQGYQWCTWMAPNAQCYRCQDLHDQVWPIREFVLLTKHEAPIFSKSHVGCRCFIKVTGVDTANIELPEKLITAF